MSTLSHVSDGSGAVESLFTYGALQAPDVQLDTFGRRVPGDPGSLAGFRFDDGDGIDERTTSNAHDHRRRVLRHTGDPHDRVFGAVLHLSPAELDAADEYLMSGARRTSAILASGQTVWVYVST